MKEQKTDNIIEEIKKKKKTPKEVKEKMIQTVFKNLSLGIIILLYFTFVNLGYHNITKDVFIADIRVFSMCLVIVAVLLFEKSYRKNIAEIAIYGIEMLFVALATLFIQYIYFYQTETIIRLYMLIPLAFAIYYVLKSIILATKIKLANKNNISDVKEIIKKEKKLNIEEPTEDKDSIANSTKNEKQYKLKQNSAKKNIFSKNKKDQSKNKAKEKNSKTDGEKNTKTTNKK